MIQLNLSQANLIDVKARELMQSCNRSQYNPEKIALIELAADAEILAIHVKALAATLKCYAEAVPARPLFNP